MEQIILNTQTVLTPMTARTNTNPATYGATKNYKSDIGGKIYKVYDNKHPLNILTEQIWKR